MLAPPRRRPSFPALVVAFVALLLAAPAVTRAATVSVRFIPGYKGSGSVDVTLKASPGETNELTVGDTIHDDGAPLTLDPSAVPTCSSVDAHTVRCDHPLSLVDLGDGNDTLTETSSVPLVLGGPGDDVIQGPANGNPFDTYGHPPGMTFVQLHGGPGNDTLSGGAGDQGLFGDEGDDHLNGQAGNDELHGGPGNDQLDGGPGNDVAVYGDDGAPAFLDLLTGDTGDGTHDTLTSIETFAGGPGADTLKGTDGPDILRAGYAVFGHQAGGDQLFGRGGNDELFGQPGGPVVMNGGTGDDLLRSEDRGDRLSCGPGNDIVDVGSNADDVFFPRDCDRLFHVSSNPHDRAGYAVLAFTHGHVARGRLLLSAQIFRPYATSVCRAPQLIVAPSSPPAAPYFPPPPPAHVYGHTSFKRSGHLSVTLDPSGHRAARLHRVFELRLELSAREFGPCLRTDVVTWRVRS